MINPYADVNWNSVSRIASLSHAHSHGRQSNVAFRSIVSWYNDGIRHFPYSNYYPSHPSYPIESDEYWPRGVLSDIEKFTAWKEENNINDIIECPNAEHHEITNSGGIVYSRLHINGLGSTLSTGNPPDVRPVGCGLSWQNLFKQIFDNLLYDDGGGATINHPEWTMETESDNKISFGTILKMLDYDDRVLGIEIYNHTSEMSEGNGWALDLYDKIVATGRKCWAFAVPDHHFDGYKGDEGTKGRNILLVPSVSNHECLKAYRDGRFYSQLGKTALAFSQINLTNNVLNVGTQNAERIEVVTNKGTATFNSNSVSYNIPNGATYVRVQAFGLDDAIYSNAITIKERKKVSDDISLFYD